MYPLIIEVKPGDDYTLSITFQNGEFGVGLLRMTYSGDLSF